MSSRFAVKVLAGSLAAFLVGSQAAPLHAQAGQPLAIKVFQFVFGGQIYQSGASIETISSQGDLELGVFSTTGQAIPNVEWRVKTADGSFDTGMQTAASIVAGPGSWSLLKTRWTMATGTHRFIASVLPPRGTTPLTIGGRGPTAEFTLNVRVITVQPLNPGAIGISPLAVTKSTLEDPSGHCKTDPPTFGSDGVKLVIRSAPPAPAGFTGCALVTELFRGVRLGNGWEVTKASVSTTSSNAQPVWEVEPSGTSLTGRLRMPVTPSYPVGYYATVRIHLKGQPGTQPTFVVQGLQIH